MKISVTWCGWQMRNEINLPPFPLVHNEFKSTISFNFNKHILAKGEKMENIEIPNYNHNIDYLIEEAETGVLILSCGCQIELDGICEHGNKSPLLILGMI